MRPPLFKLSRLIVLLALVYTTISPTAKQTQAAPSEPLAKAPFEVRLRKLHLVRPDLIPYPVYFEVYC